MKRIKELILNSIQLGIKYEVLGLTESSKMIHSIVEKYNPVNMATHPQISSRCLRLPIDEWEYDYSKRLKCEPGYVMFRQGTPDGKHLFWMENVKLIGDLMSVSFGIEYFVTGEKLDYLVAVNLYSIHVEGIAKRWFKV